MTQEERNLAETRKLYAVCAAGDWEAVRQMLADDFLTTEAPELPYAGEYRGRDGLREIYTRVMATINVERMDLIEMTAAGDWVIVLVTMHARDAEGSFPIELAEATRFRDGKIVEIKPFYFDPASVRRAVTAKLAMA